MLNPHLIAHTSPVALPENQVIRGNLRVTVLSERLFRVESADPSAPEGSRFCDEATQVVWFRDMSPVPFTREETGQALVLETAAVRLEILPDLWESRVFLKGADGTFAAPVRLAEDQRLPGTYRTLDGFDGDLYIPHGEDLSKAFRIQLDKGVTSRNGVAVLDDSASLILGADGLPRPRSFPESDLYIFAFGRDYRAALKALFMITQAPPAIPRFALGNWWSRYHAYSEKEYLDLMDSFADRAIPFTVATVDMDWHPSHDLPDGADGWTGYSWNRELFPDYHRFLRELRQRGMAVTLNLHPALGVRWFEEMYPEMAARMGIDPESRETVPFDITDEAFIRAYFEVLHHPYEEAGVDFWWIDWQQGLASKVPGLDPLWSLNHFHSLDSARRGDGLILSRYAGVGSHRYPLGFSGDTLMTWNSLRFLPVFTANATNIGYTWWSHDIGGHMMGYKDDELYARFIQFGVFSPVNRIHSSNNPMLVKEPDAYPGGIGLIAREFLQLRHAMIPFLYTASRKTAEEGLALVEPMYYGWPDQEEAYRCPGQYLFGQQLIAAPITEPAGPDGLAVRDVWLPEGTWTDLFTHLTYTGGGWRKMVRALDAFPLLLREGGFFVLDGAPAGNSTALPEVLRVLMAGGSGAYTLTEEDNGKTIQTSFAIEQLDPQTLRLRIHPGRGMSLALEFRTVMDGAAELRVDGQPVPCRVRGMLGYSKMMVENLPAFCHAEVLIRDLSAPEERRIAAITRAMQQIQGDNIMKDHLCARLTQAKNRMAYEALIRVSNLSEHDKLRLLEIGQ